MRKVDFILSMCSGLMVATPFLAPALFPVAWIGLIPLLWVLRKASLPWSLFCGWVTGIVTHLVGFYWLNYTISVFGGHSYATSTLVFAGFGISNGLLFALFALFVRLCGFGPMGILPAFFWVTLEFWFPLLFPWHLANSQTQFLKLIQSGDLVGPYGVSFLLVWVNTIILGLLTSTRANRKASAAGAALAVIFVSACLLYGDWRLTTVGDEMRQARTLSVAAVQGGIDINTKWNINFLEANLQSYLDLSRNTQGATLALWPESAVENWISESVTQLPKAIVPELPPDTKYLIFGARSFRGNPATPNVKAFNSAFLIDSEGRVLGHYHKQVLLAFGEYIPFVNYLAGIPGVPAIGQGFTPGSEPRTLDLPNAITIGPLICYEDLMPPLARAFVRDRHANLLINLTNDAWFGKTVAAWQHARLAQWRAIETRRTLIRVTNTGVTTVINAKGEMLESLPLFSTGVLKANVELLEFETLYVRFGDWFAWLATVVSVLVLLRGARFTFSPPRYRTRRETHNRRT